MPASTEGQNQVDWVIPVRRVGFPSTSANLGQKIAFEVSAMRSNATLGDLRYAKT